MSADERACHFCKLPILDGEKAIEAKTGNAWAHVTCWYSGEPFERQMLEQVTETYRQQRKGAG